MYRIGDLASRTGTKVETVRWYEKVGLLPTPERTSGNYRLFGEDGLARLAFIRRARGLGFSLDQVRELISLADDQSRDCATVDQIARLHLADVDQRIADLERLRGELARITRSCSGGIVGQCRILEALDQRQT